MRVALVNHTSLPVCNIGLASIIATLRQEGHDVRLIDLAFTPRQEAYGKAIGELQGICPDVIGISTDLEFDRLQNLIHAIREEVGSQPLLLGGTVPTYLKSIHERFHGAGLENIWMFAGEANRETALFIRKYGRGHLPTDASLIQGSGGAEGIIPDFRLFDMPRYFDECLITRGCLYVRASTGCPYPCSYCSCNAQRYSHRRPEDVLSEVLIQESRHRKDGMRTVFFQDNTFGLHKRQFSGMMDLFRKEGLPARLPWCCQTRPEVVTAEWARKAANAGCFMVDLGLECYDEAVRRHILKREHTNRQFKGAIANLREAGIVCIIGLMAGVPGTSFWTDVGTALFAHSCAPAGVFVTAYYPAEGTALGEKVRGGERMPCISSVARRRALIQQMILFPALLARGIATHRQRYLKEVAGHIFNLGRRQASPLFRSLADPLIAHQIFYRPIIDLQVEKSLRTHQDDEG